MDSQDVKVRDVDVFVSVRVTWKGIQILEVDSGRRMSEIPEQAVSHALAQVPQKSPQPSGNGYILCN